MQPDAEAEGLALDPREILKMVYRRRVWLFLFTLAGLLLAGAAVLLQKPVYKSTAILLIDSQQIPTALVAAPLTNIANERISKIRQHILSRESLTAIVQENGLYPRQQQAMVFDEVLDLMRAAIAVDLVPASETHGDTGQTIAFTVSFTYDNPVQAQAVTQTLTDIFLQQDVRFRTEQATGTAAFLARRADELARQLSDFEEERRAIEARYAGALPHQVGLSAQAEGSLRAEIARIDTETQALMQQNSLLAARGEELAQAPRPEGEALRRAEERLRELNAIYSDDYPEVVAARAAVERHRQALQNVPQSRQTSLQTELASGRARLDLLASRRAQLVSEMGATERRSALAPQASYELTVLEREYDNIRRQYEDLREKQLEAQVSVNLQTEGKGEHFSVVDEPSMPQSPDGPKPALLLILGLVAGAGAGASLIVAYELLIGAVHGEAALTRILGAPPMGIIPHDNGGIPTIFKLGIPILYRSARGGLRHAS